MTTITYKYNAIGWVRIGKGKGEVLRYKIKNVCNCITSFASGGGTKTLKLAWLIQRHTF